jgi:hypothetical protein
MKTIFKNKTKKVQKKRKRKRLLKIIKTPRRKMKTLFNRINNSFPRF